MGIGSIITYLFTRDGRLVVMVKEDQNGLPMVDNLIPWFVKTSRDGKTDSSLPVLGVSKETIIGNHNYDRLLAQCLGEHLYNTHKIVEKNLALGQVEDYGQASGGRIVDFIAYGNENCETAFFVRNGETECRDLGNEVYTDISYRYAVAPRGMFPDPSDGQEHEWIRFNNVGCFKPGTVVAVPLDELSTLHDGVLGISQPLSFGVNNDQAKLLEKISKILGDKYSKDNETSSEDRVVAGR